MEMTGVQLHNTGFKCHRHTLAVNPTHVLRSLSSYTFPAHNIGPPLHPAQHAHFIYIPTHKYHRLHNTFSEICGNNANASGEIPSSKLH